MDINLFRGLTTAAWLILFIGLCVWAWSKRRDSDFEASAALPLQEDFDPTTTKNTDNREDR